jgi:ubiquinone/menaquinone biosynthesis C-methylase UbiE
MATDLPLPPDAVTYYEAGREHARLERSTGALERMRTQELIARYVPPPPATVLDVGGGTGPYAFWLAEQGYTVHLLDAMPLHVEQARRLDEGRTARLAGISEGDARHLPFADESADVVLLLGPLYHLTGRGDRLEAWREAHRVARVGGVVLAAGISRYASLLDGLSRGFLDDPDFVRIVREDLATGQHRNPAHHPDYFATAYFHVPGELREEAEDAGWRQVETLAIEGPAWLFPMALERLQDEQLQAHYLEAIRSVERDPALLPVSAHIMAVAEKTLPLP